jgi:hypothetical protein
MTRCSHSPGACNGDQLGVATIASTAVFGGLKPGDGSAVSQHRAEQLDADVSAGSQA